MPSYRVKSKGFFDGAMYEPEGKRRVVTTDKPLKPVPEWLELIDEKVEAKAARLQAEAEAITAANNKKLADKQDVTNVDFTGGSNVVETL